MVVFTDKYMGTIFFVQYSLQNSLLAILPSYPVFFFVPDMIGLMLDFHYNVFYIN